MAIITRRKSDILTDEDYQNVKVWQLNQALAFKKFMNLGSRDDAILEATQNAIDSPEEKKKHLPLRIDFMIPYVDMPEYGRIILRVTDIGGGLTSKYNYSIDEFRTAFKASSEKTLAEMGANGLGMIEYFLIGQTFEFITLDENGIINRFACYIDEQTGMPVYGKVTQAAKTPENCKKFGIYQTGTIVTWYDKRENVPEINLIDIANKIRNRFGWRLMDNPQIEIYINGKKLQLPEYLRDRKPIHLGHLGFIEGENKKGERIRANPFMKGWVIEHDDGHGKGMIHVDGYHICDTDFVPKKATIVFSIEGLDGMVVVDSARLKITHDGLDAKINKRVTELLAKCKDIDTDKKRTHKEVKKMNEVLSKVFSSLKFKGQDKPLFNAGRGPEMLHPKTLQKGELHPTPEDTQTAGYRANTKPRPIVIPKECERCHHLKIYKGDCNCKCHKKRTRNPENINYVGIDGMDDVMRETLEEEAKRKEYNDGPKWLPGDLKDEELLVLYAGKVVILNRASKELYKWCFEDNPKLMGERIAPFAANIYIQVERPDVYGKLDAKEFRMLHEKYVVKILGLLD